MNRGGKDMAGAGSRLHYSWIVLSLCFLNLFFGFGAFASYSIVLPEMMRDLGLSRGVGANILNAYYFSYICVSPAAGYLADRFGARRVVPLFWLLLGIGALLMGSSRNAAQAAICFGFVGIGNSSSWTPSLALVQRWFVKSKKGMALGILGAGIGLIFIVMGRAAPAIITRWNWRYCFYLLGAAQLAMVCVNVAFMRDKPERIGLRPWGGYEAESAPGAPAGVSIPVGSTMKEFAGTSRFWLIGSSYALAAGAVLSITAFLVDYSKSELGFTIANASLLASVHGIGQIVGVLGILSLSDFTGRRAMIIVSNLCIAACIAGIILSGGNRAVLIGCVGLFGAFYGATFPMYGACGGDYFRKEIMGSVIGLFTLFYGIGAIATSRFVGYLRDRNGSYVAPFAVAACLALASAGIMALVKKKSN